MTFEWTGKEEAVNTQWSNGKRRWFKIPDGRVFYASGVSAMGTGFEVAIFSEDGEWVSEPNRTDWDSAVKEFLEELKETEATK